MSKEESTHWWFMGRREICKSIISTIDNSKNLKILEVGCGTGGNLLFLNDFGEVSAFEIEPIALEIAKEQYPSYRIVHGSCPSNIAFTSEKFDLICLFDVLEHIEDDRETLNLLKGMLSENGKIVLTVPAYQWMYGPHDEFLHHKRRYTYKRLSDLTTSVGLIRIRLSYFNTLLFPLAAIARIKDRLIGNKKNTGAKKPYKIINELLYIVFSREKHLLKYIDLNFGVSIIGIFKK